MEQQDRKVSTAMAEFASRLVTLANEFDKPDTWPSTLHKKWFAFNELQRDMAQLNVDRQIFWTCGPLAEVGENPASAE